MEVQLFTPHAAQLRVIDGFADSPHKFGVFVAPRQIGKTLLGINLMLYWLLSNKNMKGAWLSPIFAQARKVQTEIASKAHEIIEQSNKADYFIKFKNGSTLQFLSTDSPDSIRGYSFNYVILDECAYMRENAINEAILPTMNAIGKKCLMISTPRGKNHFYNWYLKGVNENDSFISFRAKTEENPYADLNFIAQQKLSLPNSIFKAEYEGEFTDSSSDVFTGIDNVCMLSAFENMNKHDKAFFGIDTGLSGDMSVLTVINETGKVLFIQALNGDNISTIANKFLDTLNNYNIVGGYVETNGIGQAMYDLIYPRQRKTQKWTMTQDSKTSAVRSLITDIQEGIVELPSKDFYPKLYNELAAYTYKISANGKTSFTHPPGLHDDHVDALMLANVARSEIKTRSIYIGARETISPKFGVPR
jgi:hypothetical protein